MKQTRSLPGHIGPFPARVKPVRVGLYKRVCPVSGTLAYAWWDGAHWGLFSTSKTRAIAKAGRRSKKQLQWYGRAQA